jgi:hypothetical protein
VSSSALLWAGGGSIISSTFGDWLSRAFVRSNLFESSFGAIC